MTETLAALVAAASLGNEASALPRAPDLGLAGVRYFRWPKSGKPDFGWGGVGGGGPSADHRTTPTRLASLATLPTRGRVGPSSWFALITPPPGGRGAPRSC